MTKERLTEAGQFALLEQRRAWNRIKRHEPQSKPTFDVMSLRQLEEMVAAEEKKGQPERLKKAATALLLILKRNQRTKRTGHWKPYMLIDAVHKYGCPATRLGGKSGACNCGATAMCDEFDGILKDLKKAVQG